MSKDPLEELFGPISEDPQPVPARERLSYEQSERVHTAKLQTADSDRGAGAKPWIIVGIVAVVAIVLSIVVVNLVRGDGADPEPTASTAPSTSATKTPTTTTPGKTETPEETKAPETPAADQVPKVAVGDTSPLPITQWGATSQLSQKFGSAFYNIDGDDRLVLTSPLIDSLPMSCEAMRSQWGAIRVEGGKFEIAKPAERCAETPELYDELWGLTDAFVKSIEPL